MNLNVFHCLVLSGIGGAFGQWIGGGPFSPGINIGEPKKGRDYLANAMNQYSGLVKGFGNELGLIGGLLRGGGERTQESNGKEGGSTSGGIDTNKQAAEKSSVTDKLGQTGGFSQGLASGNGGGNGQEAGNDQAKNQVQGHGSGNSGTGGGDGGDLH